MPAPITARRDEVCIFTAPPVTTQGTPCWSAAHPPFAYSDSRYRQYRRCPVAYYLQTYGSWRGWEASPNTTAWLAYRCKQATPLAALVGTAVHEAMESCVRALVARKAMPAFDRLRTDAAATLNTAWASSRRNRAAYLARPARIAAPMLLELLYGTEPTSRTLDRLRQKLDSALGALIACDEFWEDVRRAAPSDVRLVDPFFSFALQSNTDASALQVYAAPDLLVRPEADAPWIITDVKSGGTDGVIDQLLTYAVAARDGLRLPVGTGYVGQVVALGAAASDRILRFAITPDEIDDAARAVRENARALSCVVADPTINAPVPLDTIPGTKNESICRYCAYRAVCWPTRYSVEVPVEA